MLKKELRKIFRERRSALNAIEREKMHDLILIQFQRLPIEIPTIIMTYAAFENEFDPQIIIDYCNFKQPNQIISMPVVSARNNEMKSILVDDDTIFSLNQYGIPEPEGENELQPNKLEMVLIPLLAFDKKGNRVGYGKGYYDRFLKKCNADVIKVGFSYFNHCDHITDINEHDIPLDHCITPTTIYSFTS